MEALKLLQATESSTLKAVQVRVVAQIELLQIAQLAECTSLNPGDVVGEEPQNLVCDGLMDRKERKRVEGGKGNEVKMLRRNTKLVNYTTKRTDIFQMDIICIHFLTCVPKAKDPTLSSVMRLFCRKTRWDSKGMPWGTMVKFCAWQLTVMGVG